MIIYEKIFPYFPLTGAPKKPKIVGGNTNIYLKHKTKKMGEERKSINYLID